MIRKRIFGFLLMVLLVLFLAPLGFAQAAPAVSVVNISASATSFAGLKGTQPATIDTFGVQLTKTVSVAYEHIGIPTPNWRAELGTLQYSNTVDTFLPKSLKTKFVVDVSNLVATVGGGAGKLLTPTGNHVAWTLHGGITRPLASHMGWQIFSYQYLRTTIGAGVINKSYQTLSTGPLFYF